MVNNIQSEIFFVTGERNPCQVEGRQRQKAACCQRKAQSNLSPQLNLCETGPSGRGVYCVSLIAAVYARERSLNRYEDRSEEKGKAFPLLNSKTQFRQNLPS